MVAKEPPPAATCVKLTSYEADVEAIRVVIGCLLAAGGPIFACGPIGGELTKKQKTTLRTAYKEYS
jgi:hypothetical protein